MSIDHYCNCEDFPCCGHGSGAAGGGLDPEDAVAWLGGLDEGDREFAERYMVPCSSCGEMRPRDDPSIQAKGICYMCQQDPQRGLSEVASRNLVHFREKIARAEDSASMAVAELEAERAKNRKLEAKMRELTSVVKYLKEK